MQRLIWTAAGLFAFVQAVFYIAMLIWPEGTDLAALVRRFALWLSLRGIFVQMFIGIPALLLLFWRARGPLERGLVALALSATCAILVISGIELEALTLIAGDELAPRSYIRWLGVARWVYAGLGIVALIALRLAWRAEVLHPDAPRPA